MWWPPHMALRVTRQPALCLAIERSEAAFRLGARPFPGIGRGGWGQHPSGSQVSLVAGARTLITGRDCDLRGEQPLATVPASPFSPHAHVLTSSVVRLSLVQLMPRHAATATSTVAAALAISSAFTAEFC